MSRQPAAPRFPPSRPAAPPRAARGSGSAVRRRILELLLAVIVSAAAGLAAASLDASPAVPKPILHSDGIGPARFGMEQRRAVAFISRLLGAPTKIEPSFGCGPRLAEVEWNELAAEFWSGRFTGYRYVKGGLDQARRSRPDRLWMASSPSPYLSTPGGITLGSTLAQVRAAEGQLRMVGTYRWQAANGMIFGGSWSAPSGGPSSPIIEVKVHACGDY